MPSLSPKRRTPARGPPASAAGGAATRGNPSKRPPLYAGRRRRRMPNSERPPHGSGSGSGSGSPRARPGRRAAAVHAYLMRPVNMIYAGEDRQRMLVGRLKTLADSLDSPVAIDMYREREEMMFGSRPLRCSNERTVLSSHADVSALLDQAGFAYERVRPPRYEVASSSAGHAVLANGLLARCYSLHGAPDRLRAGWIYSMFGSCDFVRMLVSPVPASSHLQVLRAAGRAARDESRASGTMGGAGTAAEMRERVLGSGSSSIVSVRVVLGVMGRDRPSLAARASAMLARARGMRVDVRRLPWADARWLRAGRTDIRVETGSLHPLFPFISSELYERGGAAWGVNLATGGAVKYDYKQRRNYNIAIAATSGAGKSHTIKIILSRARRMYPRAFVFIVDIENEYVRFGRSLGLAVCEASPGVRLGMDPFGYMTGYRAASLLAGMLGVGPLARYAMIRAAEDRSCRSASDMVRLMAEADARDGTAHAPLAGILRMGPVRAVLEGEPMLGGGGGGGAGGSGGDASTVLALGRSFAVNSDEHRLATRVALEFAIDRATRMPRDVPKYVVLDEGWALFRDEATAESVEELARRARKYNVIIMLATQNVEDIARHRHAMALFRNCDTKIFLKLEERRQMAEVLGLPEPEIGILLAAEPGEAMVHATDNVVRTRMVADDAEMEMFDTNPNRAGGGGGGGQGGGAEGGEDAKSEAEAGP